MNFQTGSNISLTQQSCLPHLLQDRKFLHNRHQLSHQQIDRYLNEPAKQITRKEKLRLMKWVGNFLFLTKQLQTHNIRFVCIKGPPLSQRLYNDPSIRKSIDIDLLVDQENIASALVILQNEGYEFAKRFHWPKDPKRQQLLIRYQHHIPLINRQRELRVEIHWKLFHALPLPEDEVHQIVMQHLTTLDMAGYRLSVLTPEFELLYLMIHGANHYWNRLKWLLDIHQYSSLKIDETVFLDLVNQMRAGRILTQTNMLLRKYFGSELPDPHPQRVPKKMTQFVELRMTQPEEKNRQESLSNHLRTFAYSWHLFPGASYKYACTLHFLFQRPGDILLNAWPNQVFFYLYRPYSFLKRRIFHV